MVVEISCLYSSVICRHLPAVVSEPHGPYLLSAPWVDTVGTMAFVFSPDWADSDEKDLESSIFSDEPEIYPIDKAQILPRRRGDCVLPLITHRSSVPPMTFMHKGR